MPITDEKLLSKWHDVNYLKGLINEVSRYGIEIECWSTKFVPGYTRPNYYSSLYGKRVPPTIWVQNRLNIHPPTGWKVTLDGSVPRTETELVSPAFSNYNDGARSIKAVCDSLIKDRWSVIKCGGHTSIENTSRYCRAKISSVWDNLDTLDYRDNWPGARADETTWCRPGSGAGDRGLRYGHVGSGPLQGLSNTRLEFRLWEGTKNWKQWMSQVAFGSWVMSLVHTGEDPFKYIRLPH